MAMEPTAAHDVLVAEDEAAGRDDAWGNDAWGKDAVDEADDAAAAAGLAVEEVMGARERKTGIADATGARKTRGKAIMVCLPGPIRTPVISSGL
jgi:hypothetical protein